MNLNQKYVFRIFKSSYISYEDTTIILKKYLI